MKKLIVICAMVATALVGAPLSALATSQGAEQSLAAQVNINTATIEQLEQLPNVGAVIAERIIAYRDQHGAFSAPEDLMKVKGIGEKTFAHIKGQVICK